MTDVEHTASTQTEPVNVVNEARAGFEHAQKMLAVVDATTKTLAQEEGELVAELDQMAQTYGDKIEYLKLLRQRKSASEEQGHSLADAMDAYEKLFS